jgi:hypothetical protein
MYSACVPRRASVVRPLGYFETGNLSIEVPDLDLQTLVQRPAKPLSIMKPWSNVIVRVHVAVLTDAEAFLPMTARWKGIEGLNNPLHSHASASAKPRTKAEVPQPRCLEDLE